MTTTPTPSLPEDLNGDGEVDHDDIKVMLDCIQGKGSCDGCDLNGDGVYDVLDLGIVVHAMNP